MSNQWLRLWHDMPNDPKWRTIARISKQRIGDVLAVYVHLLNAASQNVTRGHADVTLEDLASAIDVTDEVAEAIWNAMQGRVLDGNKLTGWEKRQPKREDSGNDESGAKSATQRKKDQRERDKKALEEGGGHDVSRNVTTDKDKDKDKDPKPHALPALGTAENSEPECAPGQESGFDAAGDILPAFDLATLPAPSLALVNPAPSVQTMASAVSLAIKATGIGIVNPSHPDLVGLLGKGADIGMFIEAAKVAVGKGKGFAYAIGIVRSQVTEAQALAAGAVTQTQKFTQSSKFPGKHVGAGNAIFGTTPPAQEYIDV